MSEKVLMNLKMEKEVKEEFEKICDELGMTMTTAITLFAKQMIREQKLPFTPTASAKNNDYNFGEANEVINVENTTNNNEFERFFEYMKKFKDMQK